MATPEIQLRLIRQLVAEHAGLVEEASVESLRPLRADAAWGRAGAARDASFVRLVQRLAREGRSVRLAVLPSAEVVVWATREGDPARAVHVTEARALPGPTPFTTRLRDLAEHAPAEAVHGAELAGAAPLRRAAGELLLHTPLPVLGCQLVALRPRGAALELEWSLHPATAHSDPVGCLRVQGRGERVRAATLEWTATRPAPPSAPASPAPEEPSLDALFEQAVEQAEAEARAEARPEAPPGSPAPSPKREGMFTRALAGQQRVASPRQRRQLLGLLLVVALFAWKVTLDQDDPTAPGERPRKGRRAPPPVTQPTVRLGRAPTVFGRVPLAELNEVMEQALGGMGLCYSHALEPDPAAPGMSGTLELRLVIDEHGSLSKVSIGPEFSGSPTLATCAQDAVQALAWPQPDEPGAVLASYWVEFARPDPAAPAAPEPAPADTPPPQDAEPPPG